MSYYTRGREYESTKGGKTMDLMKRLIVEEEGQGMVEYALIIALISVVAITTLGLIGDEIKTVFGKIQDKLKTANE